MTTETLTLNPIADLAPLLTIAPVEAAASIPLDLSPKRPSYDEYNDDDDGYEEEDDEEEDEDGDDEEDDDYSYDDEDEEYDEDEDEEDEDEEDEEDEDEDEEDEDIGYYTRPLASRSCHVSWAFALRARANPVSPPASCEGASIPCRSQHSAVVLPR